MANSIIEVSGLCKSYSSFQLQDISFSLAEGCIMGLIGENGAGKTTTLKALLDIVRPDSGEIRLFGQPVRPDSALLKEQIGVVWENSFFYEGLTAQDIQRCMAGVYKQWDSVLYRRLLDQFQLPFRQPMQKFSRGMRMKLLIANALAHHPRLLILDEATSGLDPVVRSEILDLFLEFIQDETHSILFSSHITSDLDKIADYVTLLHQGQMLFNEEKDRLQEQYGVLRCSVSALHALAPQQIVRIIPHDFHCEALVTQKEHIRLTEQMILEPATIEQIMLFYIKGVPSL